MIQNVFGVLLSSIMYSPMTCYPCEEILSVADGLLSLQTSWLFPHLNLSRFASCDEKGQPVFLLFLGGQFCY